MNLEITKGGFGEVHRAKWIDYHNSSKDILDILKEVSKKIFLLILIYYLP
jgi:hypothetical protein